jgi:hypothetical protein
MTPQTRLIAIVGGVAFVIAAAVAVWFTMAGSRGDGKGWPAEERAAFMRNCVEQCRMSPGMTEAQYPVCDTACTCAANEGERNFSVAELAAAAQATISGNASPEQTAKMDRLKAAGMNCAAGNPPGKK